MSLDFRNVNLLWSSALMATLQRLGLELAVVCPGSRSAPLAIAAAQLAGPMADPEASQTAARPRFEALPILDERSASFFALGQARRTGRAVALICSSGTASANFYPAVIEAKESGVPLLVLSADRPPELLACHAGQAINQINLFGTYAQFTELALPDPRLLTYLRQTIAQAWQQCHSPQPGPVHINLPMREPLAPTLDPAIAALEPSINLDRWLGHLRPSLPSQTMTIPPDHLGQITDRPWTDRPLTDRPLIIVGLHQPRDPETWSRSIAHLARHLQAPVLGDSLNPIRHRASLNPQLISSYDAILRNADRAATLRADRVWCIGELPTSKILRQWLSATDPELIFVDSSFDNLDPLHGRSVSLRLSLLDLIQTLPTVDLVSPLETRPQGSPAAPYLSQWQQADRQLRQQIDQTLADRSELCEAKVPWILAQHLPPETPIFIANSTPIRDVEWFWPPSDRGYRPYFNRGANGIDGTLSTAIGVAHRNRATVLLIGDLSILHDSNGFLIRPQLEGHLTIILVNNNGGGIFELLPIATFEPPFEAYFGTPQNIDFAKLSATYNIDYQRIESWTQLQETIQTLPDQGIRLLEIRTDRKAEAQWRLQLFRQFSEGL